MDNAALKFPSDNDKSGFQKFLLSSLNNSVNWREQLSLTTEGSVVFLQLKQAD